MTQVELQRIARLQAGDQSAVAELYDAYSAALYGVITKVVKDTTAAEDVLQDAFVKIWLNRTSFDNSKGSLFTWMLNISRNLAIDALRRKAVRPQELIQTEEESVDIEDRHGYDAIVPEHVDVRDSLQILPQDQKFVVELMYFKGYTHSEISEEFNIPLGTVKSRLRLAMISLRTKYGVQL